MFWYFITLIAILFLIDNYAAKRDSLVIEELDEIKRILAMSPGQRYRHDLEIDNPELYNDTRLDEIMSEALAKRTDI